MKPRHARRPSRTTLLLSYSLTLLAVAMLILAICY
jgi:hypothetical protein